MLVKNRKIRNMKVRNLGIVATLTSTLGCASPNANLTAEKNYALQRMQDFTIARICTEGFLEKYEARMQGPAMKLLSTPKDRALVENIAVGVVLDNTRQCEANVRELFNSGVLSMNKEAFERLFNPRNFVKR